MDETKIWFVTDLCGSTQAFKKVLNVVEHSRVAKRPDIVILGGNLTGHEIGIHGTDQQNRPFIEFRGEHCLFDSEDHCREFRSFVETVLGGYMFELKEINDRLSNELRERRLKRLAEWLEILNRESAKNSLRARLLVTPGPNEPSEVYDMLSNAPGMELCEDNVVELGPALSMLSIGATVWKDRFDLPEQPPRCFPCENDYYARIQELVNLIPVGHKAIFNLHMPPYGTALDFVQRRDEQMRPIETGLGSEDFHVGSKVVKQCLEQYKPIVSLHSYPADTCTWCRISDTVAINAGSEARSGFVSGAWLVFKGLELSWQHTAEDFQDDSWNRIVTLSERIMYILFRKSVDIAVAVNDYRHGEQKLKER